MKFSLLIPVYKGDRADWLEKALQSIASQSLLPDEVVLVEDGKIPQDLKTTILAFQKKLPLKIIPPKNKETQNQGLANALNKGVAACKYEWIARFDADDINFTDRFQKQIAFLKKNPSVDLVGGHSLEFFKSSQTSFRVKKIPYNSLDVRAFAKKRNPFNHMTVFYKKSAILKAGGYENFPAMEDYHLWVKMLLLDFRLVNLPENFVLQRANQKMFARRRGLKYLKTEWRLHSFFLKSNFINLLEFIRNIILRSAVRFIPAFLLRWAYGFVRKEIAQKNSKKQII